MAKRGGSELTHENWDQEEEREEAGTFKKAPEGDLKGRVIKRARRRNAGTDEGTEKKNVFSGFGGFSAKQDSSQAFSFLAKPVEPEKPAAAAPAGGFVFGSVGGATAPAKPAQTTGFSFGSQSPGPAKPSFGAFGAETKSESPAPVFGSFTTDKSTSSPGSTPLFGSKSDTAAPAATFGSFAFGAKKDSTPDSVAAAKTDELPSASKSVEKAAITPAFGGGAFKFGGDTSGKSDSGTSSGLFSFGAAASKPTENKEVGDKGVGGGFSFGAPSSGEKPSGAAFSFGSTPTTEKSDTGGFSFGTKQAETTKPFGSGFAFGGKSSDSSSGKASPGFSFGEKSDTSATEKVPPTSFAFGVKSDSEKQPIGGSFSFGTTAAPAAEESDKTKLTDIQIGSKAVKSATPTVDEDDSQADDGGELSTEYLSHLKALNVQVLAWLKQHIDSNPLVILSPVFKDYDKHLKEITDQYGTNKTTPAQEKSTSSTAPVTISDSVSKPDPKPLGQAAFGSPKTSSSGSPFSFSTSDKPVNSTAPFSFGVAGQQSSLPNPVFGNPGGGFGTGGGFSFGSGGLGATTTTDSQGAEGAKEDDDEDQPPVVEVKQVEESDAIYDKKCKLFYKKDGKYVEKGLGMLYLKPVEGGKTQLLVRADTNLGNVLLNILLNPQIPTTRVGKNNVMLVCVPNPPVDPKADTSAPCPMLLRVKNGDDADELKAKLDELKAEN